MGVGSLAELYASIKSLWLIWCMLLFGWIVVSVLRPRRRRTLEGHARIPLEDDEER